VTTGRSSLGFDAPNKGRASRSADGRWELSLRDDHTLRLADLTAPRRVHSFREITWGGSPAAGDVTVGGRWKVTAADGYAFEIWEAATGILAQVFRGHTGLVNSVFVSADGRWALSGSSDKTLRLWEVATGRCIRTLKGHTQPVSSVFLSADGRWALSASSGRTLRLWNLELICGADRPPAAPILLCHVTSSEEAGRAQEQFANLCASAQAATASGHYGDALSLLTTARKLPGYEVAKESLDLWASAGSHCVRKKPRDAWCVQTFDGHTEDVHSVFLSADGRRALSGSGDRTVRLWEVLTGRCEQTFSGHADWVRSVTLGVDGRQALSGSWDKTLRLWDVATGACVRTFQGHTNYVTGVSLCADGCRVFSGSWDRTVRLWDVSTGRCLQTFQGHANYVNTVSASRDGRWVLSGSEDNTVRLWEVATGRSLRTFGGHGDWVYSVAFGADGRRALSGSKDRTVRLWDVSGGRCQRVLEGHTGPVNAVFLSADGRWALSGSKDKTARLWEVDTGHCHHVFEGHTSPVTSVFLSDDGRWALSGGEDQTLRLWELDWEYEFPGWADWDEQVRPYLETFLTLHCPFAEDAMHRSGPPEWNDNDFRRLLAELGHRGFGWLRPEGVRKQLEEMSAGWQGPLSLPPK
jgi:WD40 repeat protein